MKDLTVKQLAAISGVTVRTLHHYDEIGLLKPAHTGENGYRYYGRRELLRLQRILFHRELGTPLGEIADLLAREGEDEVGVLMRQRERLEAERARYGVLIGTIDLTIASIRGETPMSNADLYKGFNAQKQADYEAWLIERFGASMKGSIERSREAFSRAGEAGQQAMMAALQPLEEGLAEGLRRGLDPDSDILDGLVKRHRAWVSQMWGKPCEPQVYAGLADLYLAHPDFVKRYETIEPGFAAYLAAAMKAHAMREQAKG